MAQISLKGSFIDPTLIRYFKTFDEFYKYADPIYAGRKTEFEELYYKYHSKPQNKKEAAKK